MRRGCLRKVLVGLLFALPVIFFVVSYFLITVSGEDIFQGVGTAPAVWKDMWEAFSHNARIPDMYAWVVINFFDYQYSFGVDTIFRLIDVLLAVGMLYLMTEVALGKKPKFTLGAGMLWALGFIMIFLTPHGRVLYAGFSAIHNYLLIVVISLGFGFWYLRQLRNETENEAGWERWLMLGFGVVFGMSSNLTPVAFLITAVGLMGIMMIRKKSVKGVIQKIPRWGILGVVGILLGMGVSYIGGPGVTGYLESGYTTEYDYVSFKEVLAEPGQSAVRLVKHMVKNLARVVGPVAGVLLVLGVFARILKRGKIKWWPEDRGTRRVLAVLGGFMIVHVVIAVQLNAPLRILLPAYVAGVMVVMILAREWFREGKILWEIASVVGLIIVMIGIVGVRTVLAIEYRGKAGAVLERIRTAEGEVVCVTREEVRSRVLPVVYLGQEDMLADWAMPAKVYGKEVRWCE